MCVQNVPFKTKEREWMEKEYMEFKTREEGRKRAKDEYKNSMTVIINGVELSIGFVPLCGPEVKIRQK